MCPILAGHDTVMSFQRKNYFYTYDLQCDWPTEETRNLTMWLDEHNSLSLAMGNFETSSTMDIHTDYDIIDTKKICVQSIDISRIGYAQIAFHYHNYFQFGSNYTHWQFLGVSCQTF